MKEMSMEKLVEDLKQFFRFKDTTAEGDIILIATEKPQALFYAMVTLIERDTTKKDEWWHVTMQILTIPPQRVTWTLREPQFTGQEIFTMGGEKRFVRAVEFREPGNAPPAGPPPGKKAARKKGPALRVVK